MGTIIERERGGKITFTAQILRKKSGVILHREARTFEREREAKVWLRGREAKLDSPEGIEVARAPNPKFSVVVERFLADNERAYGVTQLAIYETFKSCDIAGMLCADIRSQHIVEYAKKLRKDGRSPSTVGGYISALGSIIRIAKAVWGYRIDAAHYNEALIVLRKLEIIGKSKERTRRPTLDELDRLMTYFVDRSVRMHNHGVAPMHRIVAFAIFSTRRLDEIIRQKRSDLDLDHKEMLVREMKDPRHKTTNDVRCEMTDEAVQIARAMRIDPDDDRLFPFNYGQVQQGFSNACLALGILDLHFHDLRHEGISRLFEMGRTIPQAASVSGHKSWKSLQRYSHLRQSGDKFANWKWLPVVTTKQCFQIQP